MLPILYSFRRCPYAIRARLTLRYSDIAVELREVILADKPEAMLTASPKGTVPVLILTDGTVLEESLDIMNWALSQHDPDHWKTDNPVVENNTLELINMNDGPFKQHLDHYKYAVRFPEHSAVHYRDQAGEHLGRLDELLQDSDYLYGDQISLADIAIFPFIRQFAFVDKQWFDNSQYHHLQSWLESMLELKLFADVMQKFPKWSPGDEPIIFKRSGHSAEKNISPK